MSAGVDVLQGVRPSAMHVALMVRVIDSFLEAYEEMTLAELAAVFGDREARLVAEARLSLGRPLLGRAESFS